MVPQISPEVILGWSRVIWQLLGLDQYWFFYLTIAGAAAVFTFFIRNRGQ